MMDTHVSISSNQCSHLLVEAEQGRCRRAASPTSAGVFVEAKELAAPRATRVQGRDQDSQLSIFLGAPGEEGWCPPPAAVSLQL